MYKSTIIALALAASTAPSFGAPVRNLGNKIQTGVEIGNGVINAADGLKQVVTGHQRRELEEIFARMDELEAREDDPLFARELEDIFARSQTGSESGALNFGKILKGAAHIFLRDEDGLVARDDEDLLAREESGALNFGKILKGAAHIFLRDEDGLVARDDEDLFARDDEHVAHFVHHPSYSSHRGEHRPRELEDIAAREQSGALNFGKILKGAAHIFLRDEDGLMARDSEDLLQRDDDLMSRKVHLSHVQQGVEIGNGLVNAAQGLKQTITGHQRRELEDLVARMDELEARNGDASGALNLGKIFKGAAKIFLRDEDELMARSPERFYGAHSGGFRGQHHHIVAREPEPFRGHGRLGFHMGGRPSEARSFNELD